MRYELIEWLGGFAIRHIASGAICETFNRKSAASKRFNHSYCGGK